MDKNSEKGASVLAMVLVFFGVLIIGALARNVAFLFFMVVLIGLVIGFIFYLINYIKNKNKEADYDYKMLQTLNQNIQLCEEQILKNEDEVKDIQKNINELDQRLKSKVSIPIHTRKETLQLIEEFDQELELREAKLDFYFTCREKLSGIQYNQKLNLEIAQKKEKLRELQEDHFEDLADMEQLRSNMSFDKTYIETINELSIRMVESTSIDTAQILHEELKMITKELRDL